MSGLRVIFEFKCKNNHVSGKLVSRETYTRDCPHCECKAKRLISAVRCSLEPATGSFPGATEKWLKMRDQQIALERKVAEP